MLRQPPKSTLTDTLFPYTTLFRSGSVKVFAAENTHYQTFNAGRDKSFSYRFETPGRVIVFSGDTGPSEALTELARGADILVSEVIDTEDAVRMIASDPHFPPQAQKPLAAHIRHNHLSPEAVGKMATKAGVKMVVLTHLAPVNHSTPDAAHEPTGVRD